MSPRLICATLGIVCMAGIAPAQTIVGPDSPSARYNRLRDVDVRPHQAIAPATPDVFGTAAVGAGVTFFDARFRRVATADRTHPLVLQLAESLTGLAPEQQLASVHALVSQKVRWAHDLDTMQVADLWANAGETLERGMGDSEDIAVVKMQVLKAAGWNQRDLYISIGRDKRIGTHIVLLARTPSGFFVLDDKASGPQRSSHHASFTPILTLGEGKSWIHGRRVSGGAARLSAR